MLIRNKRRDILTRKEDEASNMIRFIILDGTLSVNPLPYSGRGYYIHKENVNKAIEKKVFERLLKRPLNDKEKEALLNAK